MLLFWVGVQTHFQTVMNRIKECCLDPAAASAQSIDEGLLLASFECIVTISKLLRNRQTGLPPASSDNLKNGLLVPVFDTARKWVSHERVVDAIRGPVAMMKAYKGEEFMNEIRDIVGQDGWRILDTFYAEWAEAKRVLGEAALKDNHDKCQGLKVRLICHDLNYEIADLAMQPCHHRPVRLG